MRQGKRRRLESLITSWSFFLFFVLLFYIVGNLLAEWWGYEAWWVWLIIGLSLMSAVTSTIRFFVYREIEPIVTEVTASVQVEEIPEPVKTAKFCQSCGQKVEGTEKFCANCGSPIE